MNLIKAKISGLGILLRYALLPFIALPTVVAAEDLMFTPYLGYPVGGVFSDVSTDTELELAESESYGLIIGKDSDSGDAYEFIYSIQPTKLKASGPVTSGVLGDVDVENFLIAGNRTLNKESATRPGMHFRIIKVTVTLTSSS